MFLSAYQLVGREWSLGARFQLSQAQLKDRFAEVAPDAILWPGVTFPAQTERQAVLHRLDLFALYNHRSGFFGAAQGIWHRQNSQQNSQGYFPDLPSEDVWQFNLFAGYRFARRHAEVVLGLMNITDGMANQDHVSVGRQIGRLR